MRFGILGPTELHHEETSLHLGAAKQRGLLALLLLHAGQPVRVDTLIDYLWPVHGRNDRRKIVYSMISRIRSILGRSGLHGVLNRVGKAYQLDVDPLSVDFHVFNALMEQAREAVAGDRPAAAAAGLQQAVGLWRGEPLPELRGAAAEDLRSQLTEKLLDAHKLLAGALLRTGQPDAVIIQLDTLIRENDLDEGLTRLWLSALCAVGRGDDARRHLALFRKRFRRELHIDSELDLDSILTARPTATGTRPHQLPHGIPGFVGRADLLADLDRIASCASSGPNVVVVTGMPGIGKSALAIHWSQHQLSRYADGQLFLDAGAFGPGTPVHPSEALAHFLHALGVPPDRIPEDIDDRRHRFNELLNGRRVLVILDNVVDSAQARPLIPAAGSCLTIITSRRRLSGLTIREGVHTLVGYPLAEDEANTLLTQIVGNDRAAAERPAVNRLASIASGLPLALRIVGERIAERPRAQITELADELHDRLLWARADDDDLTTVFDWSYQALPSRAAALFRRLALHPGARISLEAAMALSETDGGDIEQTLNSLARIHLIEHDTVRHYRFHDLLRQYAQARAAADDSPADIARYRRAILTWFLRSAANAAAIVTPQLEPVPDLPEAPDQTMTFDSPETALAWCLSERDNLVAAARSAATHDMHRLAWQIPAAMHETFSRTGRHDDLIGVNTLAAASARMDKHQFGEIANLNNLGYSLCATHQYERAISTLTTARTRASQTGDPVENVCSHNLATAYLSIGDTSRAIAIYHEVLDATRQIGNQFGQSATLHRLGDAHRRQGQPALALTVYHEALRIREQLGSLRGQGQTHHELSVLHFGAGELAAALRHCCAAIALYERIRDQAGLCDALITRADIARVAGSDSAVDSAQIAVAACKQLSDSYRRVHSLAVLADALDRDEMLDEAARIRAEAVVIAIELPGPDARPLRARLLPAGTSPRPLVA